MSNISRLAELLPQGTDCAVITSEENLAYFLDFTASNGTLVICRDYSCFITDSRYIIAAEECLEGVVSECILQKGALSAVLKEVFSKHCVGTAAFEGTKISVVRANALQKSLPKTKLIFDGELDNTVLFKLRRFKSSDEIERIKRAQRITDEAFSHILSFIKEGVTEREIAFELERYMLSHGADALSFETIAVCGENGAKPHGVPGDRRVKKGDFVTMDFGAVVDFYHSDMTRTVCVGEPSDEMKKVYNIVLEAQLKAQSTAGVGVPCKAVDDAARSVISENGYGEYFGHSTGHGVGVEIHEEPCFSPSSKDICAVGDVITDEPGIYLPQKFGVRIEDMLIIGENGVQNITKSPKELIIL